MRLIERGEMMAEMMHEDGQETEPKNRHASHARTGTMSLTNRRPSEKAIATEKAPGAGIGESWGGSKDGSITFVKMMGKVAELGTRSRQVCAAELNNQS